MSNAQSPVSPESRPDKLSEYYSQRVDTLQRAFYVGNSSAETAKRLALAPGQSLQPEQLGPDLDEDPHLNQRWHSFDPVGRSKDLGPAEVATQSPLTDPRPEPPEQIRQIQRAQENVLAAFESAEQQRAA